MISKFLLRLDEDVQKWGEPTLTILLMLTIGVLLVVALFGKPLHKAAALIWIAMP